MEKLKTGVNKNRKKVITITILFIIGILSVTIVSKYASSPITYKTYTKSLDEKRNTVLTLITGATIASTGITSLKDDMGTPLSENLSTLSMGFLVVLAAIFSEKYLMPVSGYFVFTWFVPIFCILIAVSLFVKKRTRKHLTNFAARLMLFSIILYALTPISVTVSNIVEQTCYSSISETVEMADTVKKYISEEEAEEEKSGIDALLDTASNIIDGISTGISTIFETIQNFFSGLLESFAIFVVTTLLIPVVTLLILIFITKRIWNNLLSKLIEDAE